jgi:Lon protease-like protein
MSFIQNTVMAKMHLLPFLFHSITVLVSASFEGGGFSTAVRGWSNHHQAKKSFRATARTLTTNDNNHKNKTTTLLSLPIFPLRKKVRLPTETLTLNLYEERYLAMAESILDSQYNLFGAVFASDKPQMVSRGGTGPIVPLIDPGDIGVLFLVTDHAENMIPTVGGMERRRIRLVATAIGRFEIQSIRNDGYSIEASGPFIVADTCLFCDDAPLTEQETIDTKLAVQKYGHYDGSLSEREVQQIIELSQPMDFAASKLELVSFALASKYIPEGDTEKRQHLIRGKSTVARLWKIQSFVR